MLFLISQEISLKQVLLFGYNSSCIEIDRVEIIGKYQLYINFFGIIRDEFSFINNVSKLTECFFY